MISARGAYVAIALVLALAVAFFHDTLLLIFAGVLGALLIRGCATPLSRRLKIPAAAAVWLTVFAALTLGTLGVALLGNGVGHQIAGVRDALPGALASAAQRIRATPLGNWISTNAPAITAVLPDTAHVFTRATGILSGALAGVAGVLIVAFVAIASSLEPQLYAEGFVAIFPAEFRPRLRSVLAAVADTLRRWLVARVLTMALTGVLVTIGLSLLHVPLAGALGILAAFLAFIPNIGAFVAATPAVVLAFVQSPEAALGVVVMYVGVHALDDLAISPLVERRVAKLPPVLTLVVQVGLGIVAGAVGIALAAPLVAASIVVARMLWIEGALGDHAA